MKIANNTIAKDFNAVTSERNFFILSRLKASKIMLSFYRNGSCAWSNYRLSELKKLRQLFLDNNVQVVSVFESMPRDIFPFSGRTEEPFYIIADPMGLLYDMYRAQSSGEKVRTAIASGATSEYSACAATNGFMSIPQEGSNFFRMPAEFLIDEDFIVRKTHYTHNVVDFLPIEEIIKWSANETDHKAKEKKFIKNLAF